MTAPTQDAIDTPLEVEPLKEFGVRESAHNPVYRLAKTLLLVLRIKAVGMTRTALYRFDEDKSLVDAALRFLSSTDAAHRLNVGGFNGGAKFVQEEVWFADRHPFQRPEDKRCTK